MGVINNDVVLFYCYQISASSEFSVTGEYTVGLGIVLGNE